MIILYGGNGFIGRHLAERLQMSGKPAVVVARGADPGFLRRFAPSIQWMPAERFHSDEGRSIVRSASHIVYLASESVPGTFGAAPWKEVSTNVEPGFRLCHWVASENPEICVVFVSSGGTVYGSGHTLPIPEGAPLNPVSCYALQKVMLESVLGFLSRSVGLRSQILRVSNALGRWQSNPKQGIVQVALRSAMTGGTLMVFGDGSQVRDYVDADDVAEAVEKVTDFVEPGHSIYNVGSGVGHSLLDVIEIVERITGKRLDVRFRPARPADVVFNVLDCARIRSAVGWVPTTGLPEAATKIWDALQRSSTARIS